MGYFSTWMGDSFSALLVSLMALWLALVDRNPFEPCYLLDLVKISIYTNSYSHLHCQDIYTVVILIRVVVLYTFNGKTIKSI